MQNLRIEAKNEIVFALDVLRKELEDFSSKEAFIERIEPVLEAFATKHGLPIDINTLLAGAQQSRSRAQVLFSLEDSWNELEQIPVSVKDLSLRAMKALEQVQAYNKRESIEAIALRHSLEMEQRLGSAIEWLRDDLLEKQQKASEDFEGREILLSAQQTRLVRMYSDVWSIYRVAWNQRRSTDVPLQDLIAVGDRTVQALYSDIQNKRLALYVEEQALITVFFRDEAYTRPSRELLVPYVVLPRWIARHIWSGNAATHELGHNVLWNIKGLFDELLVKLMLRLAAEGVSFEHQRFWGRCMEEVFSDVYGMLQIGPAVIRSMQRILAYVPPDLLSGLDPDSVSDLEEDLVADLWEAYDLTHPPKRLRVWLSITALEMVSGLKESDAEIKELNERWNSISSDRDKSEDKKLRQFTLLTGMPPVTRKLRRNSFQTLKNEGRIVLEVILNTPLHALAVVDANGDPVTDGNGQPHLRSISKVFYHKPDYEGIEDATQELLPQDGEDGEDGEFFKGKVDVRTVLAAAEYAFEQVAEDVIKLDELSNRLVKAINQTGVYDDQEELLWI
jgi:hypothetical protein